MAKKEIIYRVQDRQGRGPWKPGFSSYWVETRPDHDNLLPWYLEFPDKRFSVRRGQHYGVGCRTVEKLRRWFTESEYKKLLSFGYRAVKMSVDQVVMESDTQAVFVRNKPLKKKVVIFNLYGG